MAVYSITYDLIKEKDYTKLINAIKALPGSAIRSTLSQWLVSTPLTFIQIRDHLKNNADGDDVIFVAKLDMPYWATSRVDKKVTEWLHNQAD
ncbi:hypothetical protein HCY58_10755 [Acinetobacter radioresistens]|uniref:hypothetical protein n=1 Tax=Acinetobacter radioresistens TaxID=40216 RepID=UPI00200555F5|nr:hypothetical protein [Acinetobacter radioresistens]MCK4087527.1 hypothetical protein [Acinetobacter radioresistens]